MTPRQVQQGRAVRLIDPVAFAVRFSRGTTPAGRIVGAGGMTLPRDVVERPAVIASHADARRRVLIHWPDTGNLGAWVDVDSIAPWVP